jgi:hypothetical protein
MKERLTDERLADLQFLHGVGDGLAKWVKIPLAELKALLDEVTEYRRGESALQDLLTRPSVFEDDAPVEIPEAVPGVPRTEPCAFFDEEGDKNEAIN